MTSAERAATDRHMQGSDLGFSPNEPSAVEFAAPPGLVPSAPVLGAPRAKCRTWEAVRSQRHRKLKSKGRACYRPTPRSEPLLTMLLDQERLTEAESRDKRAVNAAITRYLDDAGARWKAKKTKRVTPSD
jgi:hypothetical protein